MGSCCSTTTPLTANGAGGTEQVRPTGLNSIKADPNTNGGGASAGPSGPDAAGESVRNTMTVGALTVQLRLSQTSLAGNSSGAGYGGLHTGTTSPLGPGGSQQPSTVIGSSTGGAFSVNGGAAKLDANGSQNGAMRSPTPLLTPGNQATGLATVTPESGRPNAFPSVVITNADASPPGKPAAVQPQRVAPAAPGGPHPFGLPPDQQAVSSFGASGNGTAGHTRAESTFTAATSPHATTVAGDAHTTTATPALAAAAAAAAAAATTTTSSTEPSTTTSSPAIGAQFTSTAPPHHPALFVTTSESPPGSRAHPTGAPSIVTVPASSAQPSNAVRPPLHGLPPSSLLSVPHLGGGGDASARASTPSHAGSSPKSGMSLMSNDSDPATNREAHDRERPVPELSISRVPVSPVSATAPLAPGQ